MLKPRLLLGAIWGAFTAKPVFRALPAPQAITAEQDDGLSPQASARIGFALRRLFEAIRR